MSRGSQIVPVRFEPELLLEMKRRIEARNEVSANEPWSMSDFIRVAIKEKLAHMARSRRPRTQVVDAQVVDAQVVDAQVVDAQVVDAQVVQLHD